MKKYIYIIGVVLGVALVSCDLNMEPISDQSELNLGTSTSDTTRIKFKDRAAMMAVYENLYNIMRDLSCLRCSKANPQRCNVLRIITRAALRCTTDNVLNRCIISR